MVNVVILHDQSGTWGHGTPVLQEVFTYQLPAEFEGQVDSILEAAFEAFNVGDPQTSRTVGEYRARELRSLSVGDAVRIGDRLFICKPSGWEEVASPS